MGAGAGTGARTGACQSDGLFVHSLGRNRKIVNLRIVVW